MIFSSQFKHFFWNGNEQIKNEKEDEKNEKSN